MRTFRVVSLVTLIDGYTIHKTISTIEAPTLTQALMQYRDARTNPANIDFRIASLYGKSCVEAFVIDADDVVLDWIFEEKNSL